MKRIAATIQARIQKLIAEKDSLIANHGNSEIIQAKRETIQTLKKEKEVVEKYTNVFNDFNKIFG